MEQHRDGPEVEAQSDIDVAEREIEIDDRPLASPLRQRDADWCGVAFPPPLALIRDNPSVRPRNLGAADGCLSDQLREPRTGSLRRAGPLVDHFPFHTSACGEPRVNATSSG